MDSGSDTEPESEGSAVGWDAAEYVQAASAVAPRVQDDDAAREAASAAGVGSAIRSLQEIDLDGVERDEAAQGSIQDAAATIMQFLGSVSSWNEFGTSEADNLEEERWKALHNLMCPGFLRLMFEHRQIFHQIAAKDLKGGGAVVCWVDVMLVRISEAIGAFVSRGCKLETLGTDLSTLAQHKETDALYAATQLPEDWKVLPEVLGAEHTSPAAKRLALHLLYGAYALAPMLTDEGDVSADATIVEDLRKVLQQVMSRSSVATLLGGQSFAELGPHEAGANERLKCAMMLALHAEMDLAGTSTANAPFRPHTQATLLHYMTTVFNSEDMPHEQHDVLTISDTLDPPMNILLRWSRAIPWSWSLCDDPRVLNSEVVDVATVNWLFHRLGEIVPEEDAIEHKEILSTVELDVKGASAVITRILHYAASSLLTVPPPHLTRPIICALHNGCWIMSRILASGGLKLELTAFFDAACRLFVLMRQGSEENEVRDLALECLTYASKSQIASVVSGMADDLSLHAGARLEEELLRLTSLAKSIVSLDSWMDEALFAIRRILQFMTVLWHAETGELCRASLVVDLLVALVPSGAAGATNCPCVLLDCLLGASAVLELCASNESQDVIKLPAGTVDALWQMALETEPDDLLTASSFAAFASATVARISGDPLTMAEAWNYLRDTALLGLAQHFLGEDEPLALLVCPGVFKALCALLRYADSRAKQYMLSSPWTIELCSGMRQLLEDGGDEAYVRILRERCRPFVEELLQQLVISLEQHEADPDSGSEPPREGKTSASQLIFCRTESIPRIVLVENCLP